MNVKIDLPSDVEEILRFQANKAGVEPAIYFSAVFGAFLRWLSNYPEMQARGAKKGWDWILVFADYVRRQADNIALDRQLAVASDESATPQQRAEAFRAWAASHNDNNVVLTDEAMQRSHFYKE